MSILQEYEQIRREMGKQKFDSILEYLKDKPELFFSDVLYRESEWKKFDSWYQRNITI